MGMGLLQAMGPHHGAMDILLRATGLRQVMELLLRQASGVVHDQVGLLLATCHRLQETGKAKGPRRAHLLMEALLASMREAHLQVRQLYTTEGRRPLEDLPLSMREAHRMHKKGLHLL